MAAGNDGAMAAAEADAENVAVSVVAAAAVADAEDVATAGAADVSAEGEDGGDGANRNN